MAERTRGGRTSVHHPPSVLLRFCPARMSRLLPIRYRSSSVIPVTNTITLEPQTIDATVTSVSAVNGETSYQVTLFANDFITLFGPSNSVVVYVTPHTHTITSSTLGNGSVGRFRGLLFNDGGTLRMVATDIEDGVPAS